MATRVNDKQVLGEYADQGYYLLEYVDHVVTVNFKEKELAAFPETVATTTPDKLQAVCLKHKNRSNHNLGIGEILYCRDCVQWHYTGQWIGNCFIKRWDKDKYSQNATPSDMGCTDHTVRCVATAQEG